MLQKNKKGCRCYPSRILPRSNLSFFCDRDKHHFIRSLIVLLLQYQIKTETKKRKNIMGLLDAIFGSGSNEKVKEMLENGAVVIDVRSPGEFQGGHVAGSKNIPLQTIGSKVAEIKKISKPIVLCCASGNRSGQATSILKGEGVDCENGGSWMAVNGLV